MNNDPNNIVSSRDRLVRVALALLVLAHITIYCVSLIYLSDRHENIHVNYDPASVTAVVFLISLFTTATAVFWLAEFSFGYFISYYFCIMVVGYLWINCFSDYNYDHKLAGVSAAASALAFFVPAVFLKAPLRHVWSMAPRTFDRLLITILALSAAVIVIGASFNFRVIGFGDFSEFRSELFQATVRSKLQIPNSVGYLIGVISCALLPFAFACYFLRKQYWLASCALIVLIMFFPITMTKLALFNPIWLIIIALLAKMVEVRVVVVISLFVPMFFGLMALHFSPHLGGYLFDLVNFRMMAVPSNALNIYNDFFAQNEITKFCQIGILKSALGCPYSEQLGVVMERGYNFGNYNASLFATEGVASVGVLMAPFSVFLCGLVIGLGNKLSAGLPPRLILISSAILAPLLLNVPLSTVLLTHGAAVLFMLWYVTPRAVFEASN